MNLSELRSPNYHKRGLWDRYLALRPRSNNTNLNAGTDIRSYPVPMRRYRKGSTWPGPRALVAPDDLKSDLGSLGMSRLLIDWRSVVSDNYRVFLSKVLGFQVARQILRPNRCVRTFLLSKGLLGLYWKIDKKWCGPCSDLLHFFRW